MKKLLFLMAVTILLPSGDLTYQEDGGDEYTITVDGTNLRFYPPDLTINEGDSVRFLWGGEVLPHNSVEANGLFNSGDPAREVDYLYKFDFGQAGTYDYFCEPHESVGMDGVITVVEVNQVGEVSTKTDTVEDGDGGLLLIGIFSIAVLVIVFYRTRIDKIIEI